jgi:hypothetical protein
MPEETEFLDEGISEPLETFSSALARLFATPPNKLN